MGAGGEGEGVLWDLTDVGDFGGEWTLESEGGED